MSDWTWTATSNYTFQLNMIYKSTPVWKYKVDFPKPKITTHKVTTERKLWNLTQNMVKHWYRSFCVKVQNTVLVVKFILKKKKNLPK